MEWKIGEIGQVNDEWYQCLIGNSCSECDLSSNNTCDMGIEMLCTPRRRKDRKNVIFKKLEKVGEPYKLGEVLIQQYQGIAPIVLPKDLECSSIFRVISSINVIEIKLKQTEEDMEEKKTTFPKEDNALTRTVDAYVNGKISDKELIRSIKGMPDEYPYNKNNLKPFSWELAKQGKPVYTRDGRKARIICFNAKRKDERNIIALVPSKDYPGFEDLIAYPNNGNYHGGHENDGDLMMLPEKKEGWVNVYRYCLGGPYESKEYALKQKMEDCIDTVKISWEE